MLKKLITVVYILVIVILAFLITAPYLFPQWFPDLDSETNELQVIDAGDFESIFDRDRDSFIIFVGDGASGLTSDFRENLEEAMQDHKEAHVYHFNVTDVNVETSEFNFVMEALEVTGLPALVQVVNGEVISSHTHFDGASVDDISSWLEGLNHEDE